MAGKKQAFKDILRNCFPVVLEDLLDKSELEGRYQESPPLSIKTAGEDYLTEVLVDDDTISPSDTVSSGDTVAPRDTVSSGDTVSPRDTVSSGDTVSPRDTVSGENTISSYAPVSSADNQSSSITGSWNQSIDIMTNYFKMDVDVIDILAKFQTPFEMVVYLYLYRHSYGHNRQTCFTGLKPIIEWSQLSKNVVRRVLDDLETKQHIKRVGRVNERDIKGTNYRVYLPCEIQGLTSYTVFNLLRDKTHPST
jgi:hypothetical protein